MSDAGPSRSGLASLPYQLLVDSVLGALDVHSLIHLRVTCRFLQQAVDDDVVWRRRIRQDFRFSIKSTARNKGWKELYRGLADPELYTWGDARQHRLGVDLQLQAVRIRRLDGGSAEQKYLAGIAQPTWNLFCRVRCMPFPLRISWQDANIYRSAARITQGNQLTSESQPRFEDEDGARGLDRPQRIEAVGLSIPDGIEIGVPVELHAGGWSFFALTHCGQILAWGSSSGTSAFMTAHEEDFKTPTLLDLSGHTAQSLSVGREHAVALLEDGSVYEWSKRWDRPAVHYPAAWPSSFADASRRSLKQVEAGWNFTALLYETPRNGGGEETSAQSEVLFWQTEWTHLLEHQAWYTKSRGPLNEDVSPCWMIEVPTVILPAPPQTFSRIAAGDNFIIALSEDGKVYYLAIPEISPPQNGTVAQYVRRCADQLQREMYLRNTEWKLLDEFCIDLYASGQGQGAIGNIWDDPNLCHLLQGETKITHVSAQFRSFAVYAPDAGQVTHQQRQDGKGSGIVLLGNSERPELPQIMRELQGADIIKVAHGDWHSGAMTQSGHVLTWGSHSNGALGNWDSIKPGEGALSLLETQAQNQGPRIGLAGGRVSGAFQAMLRMRQTVSDQSNRQTATASEAAESGDTARQMVDAEKQRFEMRRMPETVKTPHSVRFGFPKLGETRHGRAVTSRDDEETKHVFDIAFAGWHSGALAVDRALL